MIDWCRNDLNHPPTAVGGIPSLVDRPVWKQSDPVPLLTYNSRFNPTNGSWWIVQILSTNPHRTDFNPTNGSWWIFQILSTNPHRTDFNPTNGSWWIVQILSTNP